MGVTAGSTSDSGGVPVVHRPPLPVAIAGGVVSAFRRGIGYSSRRGHQLRLPRFEARSVPLPARNLATVLHATLDELVIGGFQTLREGLSPSEFQRVENEVDAATALFEREGWLDDPSAYHTSPPPLTAPASGELRVLGTTYATVSFESGYEPHPGEPGRPRWLGYEANRTARALMLRHEDGPRPWLVCIHGAESARPWVDTRMFRAEYLHRVMGLNVLLPVLPLHGPRRRGAAASFPTMDLLDNVHGLAQAAWDVRRLLSWVRGQDPLGVGLMGFSLGGYTGALVAGLDAELDCVIGCAPASDFPALFRRNMPRPGRDQERFRLLMTKAETLHRVVSPLALPPATPPENLFLVSGLADRLAHPTEQVAGLWHHWGRPVILWHHGGHVGHQFVADATRFVDEVIGRTLVAPQPPEAGAGRHEDRAAAQDGAGRAAKGGRDERRRR
jgi:hypothetical protein